MPIPVSQPALERFDQRVLAIKADVTEGTDPTPTSAANAIQIFDGTSKLDYDKKERNVDRNVFTGKPFAVVNPRLSVAGTIELIPPATPGDATSAGTPAISPILLPSGFKMVKVAAADPDNGTTTYLPITKSIPSATSYFWHNGTIGKLVSARHALSAIKLAIDDRFTAQVQIQAAYQAIDEAALPADMDYSAFGIPTIADDTNTVMLLAHLGDADVHVLGKSLSVDLGTKLLTKRFTEKRFNAINGRDPKATLQLARPAKADLDLYALWESNELITASFQLLEADGRWSKVGIRGQIETIDDANVDDDDLINVTVRLIASDDADPVNGGDECYIEFGVPFA